MPARKRATQKVKATPKHKEFQVEYGGVNDRVRHSFVAFAGARNRALLEVDNLIASANKWKKGHVPDSLVVERQLPRELLPKPNLEPTDAGGALASMRAEIADCDEPKVGETPRTWKVLMDNYSQTYFVVKLYRQFLG